MHQEFFPNHLLFYDDMMNANADVCLLFVDFDPYLDNVELGLWLYADIVVVPSKEAVDILAVGLLALVKGLQMAVDIEGSSLILIVIDEFEGEHHIVPIPCYLIES